MRALSLFTILFCLNMSFLCSGSIDNCPTDPCVEECPDPCCPPRDPCAKCASIWPSRGPDWMITPNAGPCVACGWDVYLTTEFLYWTARQDHLGFVLVESKDDQGYALSTGKIFHPDWNFRPGFKVGFGTLQDHDGWDVYANYTWFRGRNTKRTVIANQGNVFSPVVIPASEATFPDPDGFSEMSWELDFNTIDFELGRNFYLSRCLTFRPHFGLKGTWQDQKLPFVLNVNVPMQRLYEKIDQKLDYWGVGLRAGLESSWHYSRCFSFLGEVALAALWERTTLDFKKTTFDADTGQDQTKSKFENEFQTIKPVVEFFLGFRWETWFCCDNYHFGMDGGWEIQWWGNHNQFYSPATESLLGDLYLHGLTLRLRFDF